MVGEEPAGLRLAYARGYNDGLRDATKIAAEEIRKWAERPVEPYHGIVTESDYKAASVD